MSGRNYLCRVGILLPLLATGCSTPLTGTPLDLTPFGAILSAIGLLYWLLAAGAFWLAIAYSPTRRRKVIAGLIVVTVFGYFPLTHYRQEYLALEAVKTRLAKADAMFQERCKKAGENIYRTVGNVDGIFVMKVRPEEINYGRQFAMTDPYGNDSEGESYLKTFFSGFYPIPTTPTPNWSRRLGYRYVEAIDPKDGKRYRYTGSKKAVGMMDVNAPNVQVDVKRNPNFDPNIYAFVLDKVPALGSPPRYGITYDDISTREEREYWIAGSSLKVIDLKTNEVIAERIGYMVDRGQGATGAGGGDSPWLLAASHACPEFPRDPGGHPVQADQTRALVVKVLKPILEN